MSSRIARLFLVLLLAFSMFLLLSLSIAGARTRSGAHGQAEPAARPANVDLTLDIRKAKTGKYKITYEPGSYILYEIRLRNQGTDPATRVLLTYTLPVSVWFSTSFNDHAIPYTYTAPTTVTRRGQLVWNVGTLEENGERNFYVEMRIVPSATVGLKLDSTAIVTSAETPPRQQQRSDTVSSPNLKLKKKLLASSPGYLDKGKVLPDSLLVYRLEVKNESVVTDARRVVLTDTLPPEVTFVSASGNGHYISATHTVTWNVGIVPRSQTQSYLVSVRTPATVGLSFDNTAEVTTVLTETKLGDNTDTSKKVTVTDLLPNVALAYNGWSGSPVAGGVVEIRLDVNNFADKNFVRQRPVENVVLTQTLPAGLVYLPDSAYLTDKGGNLWPVTPTVTVSGTTILLWQLGTLPNDPNQKLNDLSIFFQARLPATASVGSTFVVRAVITTSTQPELTTNDNDDQITLTVASPQPDLRLSKSGCATPYPGESCDYTLTIENTGNVVITDALLVDYLPYGLRVLGTEGGGCSPVVGEAPFVQQLGGTMGTILLHTQVATCSLQTLAPGDKIDWRLYVEVSDVLTGGDVLTNTALLTRTLPIPDANPGDNRALHVTTVQNPPVTPPATQTDLRVRKTISGSGNFIRPGEVVVYDVSLENQSTLTAQNVVLTDTVFTRATLLNATAGLGISPVISGNTARWQAGDREGNSTLDVQVQVQVSPTLQAGQSFANLAWATTPTTDTNLADNYALVYNTIAFPPQNSDVSAAKTGSGCFVPGEVVTFTLTVDNRQEISATNVVVTDTLATGLVYQGATLAPTSVGGQNLIWQLGTLAPNQSRSFDVIALLDAGLQGGASLSNTVRVGAANEDTGKLDNNADTFYFRVLESATADVALQKRHASQPPNPYGQLAYRGLPFAYVLQVSNQSNRCPASGVTVRDVLPAGLHFVEATPSPAGVNGQTLTWQIGTLQAGEVTAITLTVQVDAAIAGGTELSNGADVSTASYDPVLSNNSVTYNTAVNDTQKLYLPLVLK